jgi:hypothetical protein
MSSDVKEADLAKGVQRLRQAIAAEQVKPMGREEATEAEAQNSAGKAAGQRWALEQATPDELQKVHYNHNNSWLYARDNLRSQIGRVVGKQPADLNAHFVDGFASAAAAVWDEVMDQL